MSKYDFFIAGRWRNKDNIKPVLDAVRASGKTAYCFIENEYEGGEMFVVQTFNDEDDDRQVEQDIIEIHTLLADPAPITNEEQPNDSVA